MSGFFFDELTLVLFRTHFSFYQKNISIFCLDIISPLSIDCKLIETFVQGLIFFVSFSVVQPRSALQEASAHGSSGFPRSSHYEDSSRHQGHRIADGRPGRKSHHIKSLGDEGGLVE